MMRRWTAQPGKVDFFLGIGQSKIGEIGLCHSKIGIPFGCYSYNSQMARVLALEKSAQMFPLVHAARAVHAIRSKKMMLAYYVC